MRLCRIAFGILLAVLILPAQSMAQGSSYSTARFSIFEAYPSLTLLLLAVFAIGFVAGVVYMFLRSRRGRLFAAIVLAVLAAIYLGLSAFALSSNLSPWPLPVCVVILAIMSLLLFILRRKPA